MGSGIFPDFSILFLHYCIYVFLRLKTSFYDTLSVLIEILSAIVSFRIRLTLAHLLFVQSRSKLVCELTVIPLTFAEALCYWL